MAYRFGWPFSPEVAYVFNGSTAITYGDAVELLQASGVATCIATDWPEPDPSRGSRTTALLQSRAWGTTLYVPTIRRKAAVSTVNNGIIGVALENISASSWGHICLRGCCDIRVTTAMVVTVGQALLASATGGFITVSAALAATATCLQAMALEAVNTSAGGASPTSAYIRALLMPGEGFYSFSYHSA
jgi:hypothetical protein